MGGIAERDRRAIDSGIVAAWWIERLAREKTLKPPGHYLAWVKPKTPQTADQVLAVFREHQARGGAITITHIGPDGKALN